MKAKLFIFTALFFGAFTFGACNNKNTQQGQSETHPKILYKPGSFQIITCRNDSNESYTAYFPHSYNPKEKTAVIVVFDAHARGKLAAGKFRKAADNYGILIIASNNAKNGSKTISHTVNTLFSDIFSRFKIDAKRVYTAGFSGGAKIAASIAIQQGGIAGVISIAAGLPQAGQQTGHFFDFAGIVGIDDFNYLEMKELDKQLGLIGFAHHLSVTGKAHEWPSDSTINASVEWLQVKAIKNGIAPNDDQIIRNYIDKKSAYINQLIINGAVYQAKYEYEILLATLKNLIDITDYEKSYQVLLKNPEIKKQEQAFKKLAVQEGSLQQQYINYFKNGQFATIEGEINRQKKAAAHTNEQKKHSAKRLLNYLSMLSFIFCDSYLKNNDLEKAERVLNIYQKVDASNADVYFFEASLWDKKSQDKQAFSALKKAVGLGFSDVDRLYNPAYFQYIVNLPEFDLIVQQTHQNFDKENDFNTK